MYFYFCRINCANYEFMMYLQMYNECEFVIAYYEEKDIVLGANVRLLKLVIRLQFYMCVVGIIHGWSLD